MTSPCRPGPKPRSFWIVCSAPEMTIVSNPNRKPASAELIAQKIMRAFSFPGLEDVWLWLAANMCMGFSRVKMGSQTGDTKGGFSTCSDDTAGEGDGAGSLHTTRFLRDRADRPLLRAATQGPAGLARGTLRTAERHRLPARSGPLHYP